MKYLDEKITSLPLAVKKFYFVKSIVCVLGTSCFFPLHLCF